MKLTRLAFCVLMVSSLSVFGCGSSGSKDGGDTEDAGGDDGGGDDGGPPATGCGFDSTASNAFRLDSLSIDSPGLFLNSAGPDGGVTCASDLTTLANNLIGTAVCTDAADDEDDLLDLTLILYFSEFSDTGADGLFGPIGDCDDPAPGTDIMCTMNEEDAAEVTLTTSTSDCSSTLGSQTVNASADPDGCVTSDVVSTLLLNLGTVNIPVVNASVIGSFVGSPATAINNGSLLGFITVADAEKTTLPGSLPPPIGGSPLIDLLRGPNCDPNDVETVDLGGKLGETDGFVFVMAVDYIGVPFDTGS